MLPANSMQRPVGKTALQQLYKASQFNILLTIRPFAIKTETRGICRASVGSKIERQIMTDTLTAQERLWLIIYTLRASISLDWAKLALEVPPPHERRTITDRLVASTKALKEIKNTLQQMPKA
jgi:hypothetical protein